MRTLRTIIIFVLILSMTAALTACNKQTDEPEIDTSYDPADYVQLCDYKNIAISDDEIEISETDLMTFIRSEMDEYTTTEEITDRGVRPGDTVSINIKGYLDGKELESLKAYYFNIIAGEGTLGIDFENQLNGMKTGETKSFNITYPDKYSSETLAGNTINYSVKVNYILEVTEYEITDENVEMLSNGEFETVEQMKESAREYLLASDYITYRNRYLLRKLVDSCTVTDYPEAQLGVYKSDMFSYYTVEAINYGADDLESYLAIEYDMTLDEFGDYIDEYCKKALKEEMIYTLIAELENITLTDEEYENYVEYYAGAYEDTYYYSMTADEFSDSLGEENIYQALLINKTQSQICEWNAQ